MRRTGSFHLGVVILVVAAVPLAAQREAPRALTRPTAESADGFTRVNVVRELSNGKVLVADPEERTVQLLDLAAGTSVKVGREGRGPGEYSFPGDLLALPADSTLLVDRSAQRFLLILPDGKTGATIPFPDGLGFAADPRATDGMGRVYFQGSAIPPNGLGDAETSPDSVPILRWDRKRRDIDTVAFAKLPPRVTRSSNRGEGRIVMMRSQPFGPEDAWSVAPDGSVAVARVSDFHVDWFSPAGQRVSGPAVRYERVRVNDADKAEDRRMLGRPRIMIGPGGRSGGSAPATPPPNMPEPNYPEFKPPFPARSAWVASTGQFWVLRSRPGGTATPVINLFDRRGTMVGSLTLPANRRVAGFGQNSVYLVRTDGDGLEWVERYQLQ